MHRHSPQCVHCSSMQLTRVCACIEQYTHFVVVVVVHVCIVCLVIPNITAELQQQLPKNWRKKKTEIIRTIGITQSLVAIRQASIEESPGAAIVTHKYFHLQSKRSIDRPFLVIFSIFFFGNTKWTRIVCLTVTNMDGKLMFVIDRRCVLWSKLAVRCFCEFIPQKIKILMKMLQVCECESNLEK